MDDRRQDGYEYYYRFSMNDNKEIRIDIAEDRFRLYLSLGFNVYQLEIRTNFILKKKGDVEIIMCSEGFRLWYLENKLSEGNPIDGPAPEGILDMIDHEIEELVLDRAIRVENLVPLHCYYLLDVEDYYNPAGIGSFCLSKQDYLICHMPRTRVKDYHCIVTWLMKNDTCPLCRCRFGKNEVS